jgi:hypothetical protein
MLGKLMKHEFRATARLMLPLYIVVVALALFTRVSNWILESSKNSSTILSMLNGLLLFLFVLSIIASVIFAVVLMIVRFHKNLMTDEGYLMFTLPTDIHGLLWSKLFVSLVWFLGTILVDALACFIVVYQSGMASHLYFSLTGMFQQLDKFYSLNGLAVSLEGLLFAILTMLVGCLCFYAPISIGNSFSNHKGLLSVVFFFAIQFVGRILNIAGIYSLTSIDYSHVTEQMSPFVHGAMWTLIAYQAVVAAVLYFVTWLMLKKHLNLQ